VPAGVGAGEARRWRRCQDTDGGAGERNEGEPARCDPVGGAASEQDAEHERGQADGEHPGEHGVADAEVAAEGVGEDVPGRQTGG
jgi:hypothetical protein